MAFVQDGAILVFVPGWEDIKKIKTTLEQQAFHRNGS